MRDHRGGHCSRHHCCRGWSGFCGWRGGLWGSFCGGLLRTLKVGAGRRTVFAHGFGGGCCVGRCVGCGGIVVLTGFAIAFAAVAAIAVA